MGRIPRPTTRTCPSTSASSTTSGFRTSTSTTWSPSKSSTSSFHLLVNCWQLSRWKTAPLITKMAFPTNVDTNRWMQGEMTYERTMIYSKCDDKSVGVFSRSQRSLISSIFQCVQPRYFHCNTLICRIFQWW